MKGKWQVTSQVINGTRKYAAYRLIDLGDIDCSGNREYGSEYSECREIIQAVADLLNEQ